MWLDCARDNSKQSSILVRCQFLVKVLLQSAAYMTWSLNINMRQNWKFITYLHEFSRSCRKMPRSRLIRNLIMYCILLMPLIFKLRIILRHSHIYLDLSHDDAFGGTKTVRYCAHIMYKYHNAWLSPLVRCLHAFYSLI